MTYQEFINNILQARGRFNCGNAYHERHHIIPKCMGGTDDKDNLIDLLAREHFIAHKLLVIENPDNDKLVYALWNMCQCSGSSQQREDVSPEEYEYARKLYVQKFSGSKNPVARRVIRLNDEKIYETVKSCYTENNISSVAIYRMLKQHRKFMYYDEWVNLTEQEKEEVKSIDWDAIQHKNRSDAAKKSGNGGSTFCAPSTREKIGRANKGKNGTRVYCPELDEEFNTMQEAQDKYNVNKTSIGYCLCGKQKHAGKHPVTGELLTWVKLENKNC